VPNVNQDLGYLGIDGIKTGTTAAAGSCLLFSAHVTVSGRTLTLLGIVLGMPGSTGTPWSALKASILLVQSAESALRSATVAAPGAQIAVLEKDGTRVAGLGVTAPVTVVGWPGLGFRLSVGGDASSPRLTVTQTGGSAAPLSAPLAKLPAAAPTQGKPSTPAQSATRAAR
jgi:D-alanyl-D-alanine carboxypeptidase (penicillin-binding protein 5/6)